MIFFSPKICKFVIACLKCSTKKNFDRFCSFFALKIFLGLTHFAQNELEITFFKKMLFL